MTCRWEALSARARGLSAHLLSDERMRGLESTANLAELIHGLHDTPYTRFMTPRDTGPGALEVGFNRSLADRLGTLARWATPEPEALAPIFLEQDARNVRAIVRGVVGAYAPEQRLADAIPTPTLGRRALAALARAESPGAVAATLTAWEHPLGPALLEEARRKHPDPFRMETALARCLAREVPLAARAGGMHMRTFVSDALDERNIVTTLLLVGARTESASGELFVDGGTCVTRKDFVRAASAEDRVRAAELLARAARGTVFAAPLREPPASPTGVSNRILAARIDSLTWQSRCEPLSPIPLLLFVLRLRREARRLRRALWGASLTGGGRA